MLNRNIPTRPLLGDWGATVDALTNLNEAGFVSGLTAHSGGGQANALQLLQGQPMVQVSTVAASGDSVKLPPAIPGAIMLLSNAGGNSMNVFGTTQSGTQDTINGSTNAFPCAVNAAHLFFCPKVGVWAGI